MRTLRLSFNKLRQLPAQIGGLRHLETLDVSENPLTELPPEIGDLGNLRTLIARCGVLSGLPDSIGRLVNLEKLIVSGHCVVELPDSIGDLQNLRVLPLALTRLTRLPESIGRLAALRELELAFTYLAEVPAALAGLPNLNRLSLMHIFQLRHFPQPIIELAQTCDVLAIGSGLPAAVVDQLRAARARPQQAESNIRPEQEVRSVDEPQRQSDGARAEAGISAARRSMLEAQAGLLEAGLIQVAAPALRPLEVPGHDVEQPLPPRFPRPALPNRHTRAEQGLPPRASAQPRLHPLADPLAQPRAVLQPRGFAISPDGRRALSIDGAGNDIPNVGSFFDWLDHTTRVTADAGNPATRNVLNRQLDQLVKDLLDDVSLSEESNLRAECFAIAFDAMRSCGDGAVHGLNEMHVAVMNAKALRAGVDEKTLVGLGIDKFVLSLIEGKVQAKIEDLARASGRPGDEVETRLFFQTKLREPLAYAGIAVPLPTQGMLYEGVAGVREPELQAAAARIRNTYRDGRSMAAFLTSWPPITKFVETTYKDRFNAVLVDFGNRMEELQAANDRQQITEQVYLEGTSELQAGYEKEVADLRRRLVGEVVQRSVIPEGYAPG